MSVNTNAMLSRVDHLLASTGTGGVPNYTTLSSKYFEPPTGSNVLSNATQRAQEVAMARNTATAAASKLELARCHFQEGKTGATGRRSAFVRLIRDAIMMLSPEQDVVLATISLRDVSMKVPGGKDPLPGRSVQFQFKSGRPHITIVFETDLDWSNCCRAFAEVMAALEWEDGPEYGSYLCKRSILEVWQERWFIVRGTALMYYYSPEEAHLAPRGWIELRGARIKPHTTALSMMIQPAFNTHKHKKTVVLKAQSAKQYEHWMECLQTVSNHVLWAPTAPLASHQASPASISQSLTSMMGVEGSPMNNLHNRSPASAAAMHPGGVRSGGVGVGGLFGSPNNGSMFGSPSPRQSPAMTLSSPSPSVTFADASHLVSHAAHAAGSAIAHPDEPPHNQAPHIGMNPDQFVSRAVNLEPHVAEQLNGHLSPRDQAANAVADAVAQATSTSPIAQGVGGYNAAASGGSGGVSWHDDLDMPVSRRNSTDGNSDGGGVSGGNQIPPPSQNAGRSPSPPSMQQRVASPPSTLEEEIQAVLSRTGNVVSSRPASSFVSKPVAEPYQAPALISQPATHGGGTFGGSYGVASGRASSPLSHTQGSVGAGGYSIGSNPNQPAKRRFAESLNDMQQAAKGLEQLFNTLESRTHSGNGIAPGQYRQP